MFVTRRIMNTLKNEIFLLFFILIEASQSFRVLGVFPTQWKSHWSVGVSVLKQLALAGHDVTLVSPYELKFENVRSVVLSGQEKRE